MVHTAAGLTRVTLDGMPDTESAVGAHHDAQASVSKVPGMYDLVGISARFPG
jgi:hypothetical protein